MSCIKSISYSRGAISAPAHCHDTDHLILVCSGLVDVTISGRTYSIAQPSVIFISHLEDHILYGVDSSYTRYVINIDFTEAYQNYLRIPGCFLPISICMPFPHMFWKSALSLSH